MGRPYWGQGLAPEGVQALTAYAFEEHGVDQVIIKYLEHNKKSALVARKCGFTEVGIITDFNKYTGKEEQFGISALTRADWERVQK
ncbi:GNAT family N-acetyltransferase [Lancefieldella parvula]